MSAVTQKFKSTLLTKNFIFGFAIAVLFYAVLMLGSLFLNQSSLVTMADKLASETVAIARKAMSISSPPEQHATEHHDSAHEAEELHADELTHNPQDHHGDELGEPPHQSGIKVVSQPVAGLYELNSQGVMLPIIRKSDNLTPFQAYSAPYQKQEGFSQIALVVDDFGLGGTQDALVGRLPANTTFIMSPYAAQAKNISKSLLEKGHEIWMKAPFETVNFPEHDPGPKGILRRSSLNINQDNLKWVMGQAEVYAGIAGYTDTVFSGSNPTMNTLSRDIMNRGLGFFEINVGALPQIKDIAEKINAPYTKNDIIIHDQKWNGQFNEALELLENIAQSRGDAIGVLRVHPMIVQTIDVWSKSLARRKMQIAPLSAIIKERNPALASTMVAAPNLNTSTPTQPKPSSHNNEPGHHDEHSNTHH